MGNSTCFEAFVFSLKKWEIEEEKNQTNLLYVTNISPDILVTYFTIMLKEIGKIQRHRGRHLENYRIQLEIIEWKLRGGGCILFSPF